MTVTITSSITRVPGQVWYQALPVAAQDVEALLKVTTDKRVVCQFTDELKIQAALMPDGAGDYFINLNQKMRSKLDLDLGDSITFTLLPDNSEYGMPMPAEFRAMLDQEPEADEFFHQLTPGKQRSLLHVVGKVKSLDLRAEKSWVIAKHLMDQKGKLDFKLLNQAFKAYNQMKKGF